MRKQNTTKAVQTALSPGQFSCFFRRLLIILKTFSPRNSFSNTIRVSNMFGSCSDPTELGPNCLQNISADDTFIVDKNQVNVQ